MTIALTGFAVLLLMCFLGFRVGFATLFVGFVGFAFERVGVGPPLVVGGLLGIGMSIAALRLLPEPYRQDDETRA